MKKGISLVALTVTIVIMLLLASTVAISGVNVLSNSRMVSIGTELAYMQEYVDSYIEYNNGNLPISDSVIIATDKILAADKTQFDSVDYVSSTNVLLYKIDKSKLGNISTTYGNENKGDETDIYAVSKNTNKVYYVKGEKIKGKTYYTLTNDLKEKIGFDKIKGSVAKDGIIFTPSTKEWTNRSVTLNVAVPVDYTNVTFTVNGTTVTASKTETTSSYVYYDVSINGNYETIVKYTKNGTSLSQSYTVTKYETQAPTLTVSTPQTLIDGEENSSYVNIDYSDAQSGIKIVKYETEKIDQAQISTYFITNGIEITGKSIKVNKYVSNVTVYVEDQAGNYTYKYVSIPTSLTEDDYVKDGLILLYDGINNTGNGHSTTTRTWKDLTGNGNDGQISEASFSYSGNGWKNGKGFTFENDIGINTANILQKTTFSNIDSFTVQVKGTFNKSNKQSGEEDYTYTRILSTAGGWTGVYECIDGVDLTYPRDFDEVRSYCSYDYKTENSYWTIFQKLNPSSINIVWNKNTRELKYYVDNEKPITVKITKFDNVALKQIGLDWGRKNNKSGLYIYNSVKVYDRVLTESEIKQNYLIDKARFD